MKTLRTCSLEEKKLPGYQNNLLDLSSNLQVMPNWTFLSHYIINVNLKTGYLFNMVLHLASKQPDMFTHSFPSLTSMCGCHLCGRKLPSFLKTTIPTSFFWRSGKQSLQRPYTNNFPSYMLYRLQRTWSDFRVEGSLSDFPRPHTTK